MVHDANLEQIHAGMAWWYRHYATDQRPADRERMKWQRTTRVKRCEVYGMNRILSRHGRGGGRKEDSDRARPQFMPWLLFTLRSAEILRSSSSQGSCRID